MNDYLPVIAVFAIGFIGYLGKAGVDSILASRRKEKEQPKEKEAVSLPHIFVGRDAMKEIFAKDKAKRELTSKHSCNICGEFTTAKLCPKCRPVQEEFLEKMDVRAKEISGYFKEITLAEQREERKRTMSERCQMADQQDEFGKSCLQEMLDECEKILTQGVSKRTPSQPYPTQPPSWLKTPKTDFHNLHFFKPEEHSAVIRIMPGNPLFTAARQHYVSPAKNKVNQCGKTRSEEGNHWEGKCPICDLYEHEVGKFRSSQRDVKKYKPTERFYYNVNQGGVVRIWSVSRKVHEQIQKAIMNEDIASSENGSDITVWTERSQQFPSVKDVKLKFLHPTSHNDDSLPWDLEAYNKHCEKDLVAAAAEISETYKGCPTVPKPEVVNPYNEVGWHLWIPKKP